MNVQWWCSAGSQAWTWAWQWYPGVHLLLAVVAVLYWRASRAPETPRRARLAGWIGFAALWFALDWPLGPLAAGYLASAHAVQFLIVALVAPPLMLIGARTGIAQRFPRDSRLFAALLHPLSAAIAFNIAIIVTHVPRVNDTLMVSQLGAFAIDAAWLVGGLWFWWPITVPVPARPLFAVPFRMLYLFLGSIVHTGIAIVMLVRNHPMYGVYELAPRATGLSALDDLKIAGGVMELGGLAIIFGVLGVMFFRWSGGTGAERR